MMESICVLVFLGSWFVINIILDGMEITEKELTYWED